MRTVVAALVAGALVVFGLLLLLYLWKFGSLGLSPVQEHWGQFGDYLGGSLNPLLGFASVVLLALTLSEQRKMLAETRAQATREELQRLVAGASQRLDRLLTQVLDLSGTRLDFLSREQGLAQLLYKTRGRPLGPMAVRDVIGEAYGRLCHEHFDSSQLWEIAYDAVLREVFEQVVFVDQCILQFVERGGDPVIGELYGNRYQEPALLLHALHRMDLPTGTSPFPDEALARLGLFDQIYLSDGAVERYILEMQSVDKDIADAIKQDAQPPTGLPVAKSPDRNL